MDFLLLLVVGAITVLVVEYFWHKSIVKNTRYDTLLDPWTYDHSFVVDGVTHKMFRSGGSLKLEKFLYTWEQLQELLDGNHVLFDKNATGKAVKGTIVSFSMNPKYWVVSNNGEVLVIPVSLSLKPTSVTRDGQAT